MAVDHTQLMQIQAELLGINIAPEHQPGVALYLKLANQMADLVMAHPLGPVDEPAYFFSPVNTDE
jgi:Protein of unknown function (DUF4089)